jgi:hypothetical protein
MIFFEPVSCICFLSPKLLKFSQAASDEGERVAPNPAFQDARRRAAPAGYIFSPPDKSIEARRRESSPQKE